MTSLLQHCIKDHFRHEWLSDGTFFVIRYEDDGKYQITDANADKLQAFPKLETDIEGYYDYPFADGRVVLATWSDGKAYTAKIIAVQKDKVTAEANLAQAEKLAKVVFFKLLCKQYCC